MRLLTLTGPGGVGKTRLALEIAAEERDSGAFAGSVAFVSLGATRDAGLVAPTIAQALGLQENGEQPWAERLAIYLRPRKLLLVLDNFEQVADAAGLVADLLAACPEVKMLVSSREPLHLRGEQALSVMPLPLPDRAHTASIEALERCAAIDLFVRRAQAAQPDFTLTAMNADAVIEICRRLDGLPLALELAAARIKVLPPRAMVARLATRLALLTGGPRDLPARQQTMRETIAWSYNLLPPAEQMVFRRMAVFSGGCTLEAAEAVTRDAWDDVTALEVLGSLIDRSLVQTTWAQADTETGEPRLVMLETIREYAGERLAGSGEEPDLRGRHAAYFLELAEQVEPELRGPRQEHWLASLEQDHDNLRVALEWARQSGDSDGRPAPGGSALALLVSAGQPQRGARLVGGLPGRRGTRRSGTSTSGAGGGRSGREPG